MAKNGSPRSSISAIVAFVVTALIASILLISTLVLLLGEIIGSHLWAMVIVGGTSAIASWIIYSVSLSPIIQNLEHQVSTIYEVAASARKAYKWIVEYIIERVLKSMDN